MNIHDRREDHVPKSKGHISRQLLWSGLAAISGFFLFNSKFYFDISGGSINPLHPRNPDLMRPLADKFKRKRPLTTTMK